MYELTTDRRRLSVDVVHRLLTASYWARGIDSSTVVRAMAIALRATRVDE